MILKCKDTTQIEMREEKPKQRSSNLQQKYVN
uniref:Uncharacterized protein n=1 Tax=Rhizophora mucronata TaxID=61149 RepID=A0A2P2PQM2_RHIMU